MIEFLKRFNRRPRHIPSITPPPPPPSTLADRLNVSGAACQKCGASFAAQYPAVKYAKDDEHGERLMIVCWLCNFRWIKPVIKP